MKRSFKLTIGLIEAIFDHLNPLLFANRINIRPTFHISGSKINEGFFEGCPDDNGNPEMRVSISKYFNETYQQLCETIAHEMIHCFQYLNHMPVDHGQGFEAIVKLIEKQCGLKVA